MLRGEVTKINYSRNTFVYNSEILIFLPVEKSSFNFFPEQVKCLNIFYMILSSYSILKLLCMCFW